MNRQRKTFTSDDAHMARLGREAIPDLIDALADLREAVATHLRYLDSVIEHCRREHPDPEVAANIAQHQQRNLRQAAEQTGPLEPSPRAFHTPAKKPKRRKAA